MVLDHRLKRIQQVVPVIPLCHINKRLNISKHSIKQLHRRRLRWFLNNHACRSRRRHILPLRFVTRLLRTALFLLLPLLFMLCIDLINDRLKLSNPPLININIHA